MINKGANVACQAWCVLNDSSYLPCCHSDLSTSNSSSSVNDWASVLLHKAVQEISGLYKSTMVWSEKTKTFQI